MKRAFIGFVMLLATCGLADDTLSLGTRKDPMFGSMPTTGGAVSPLPVLQLLIALGVVLALVKLVMPRLIGKVHKKLTPGLGSQIQIEESAQFAGGTLYVVNAKSKSLLLSVTAQGVTCLADITTETKPEPTFDELIHSAPAIPDFVFTAQGRPEASPDSVEQTLARLAILAG